MATDAVREKILEAVGRVVAREGVSKTTVDAIAREAGMSKGGVLHHFPSKQEMLVGIIELYEKRLLTRRDRLSATMPPSPYRLLKATVHIMVEDIRNYSNVDVGVGLAGTSMLDNQAVRVAVGQMKRRYFADLTRDVPDVNLVVLALYVVDGLWMDAQFQYTAIPKADRERAVAALLEIIETADRNGAEQHVKKAGTPGS